MKKLISVFMCIMLLMANSFTTQAATTSKWWSTVLKCSSSNTDSVSDLFYCEKGAITCTYEIMPSTVRNITEATFILQERDDKNSFIWNDVESVTINISYPTTKGSVIFNKSKKKINKTCRVIFRVDKPVSAGYSTISYYGKYIV